MSDTPKTLTAEWIEYLSVQQLAHAARATPEWVLARVASGHIEAEADGSGWRFATTTLVRARRMAHLEQCFEADPELAALTTDLIEEVARLRAQLAMGRD